MKLELKKLGVVTSIPYAGKDLRTKGLEMYSEEKNLCRKYQPQWPSEGGESSRSLRNEERYFVLIDQQPVRNKIH